MKIILSGGTGYIGHVLLSKLLQEGHQVILFSRRSRVPSYIPSSRSLEIITWDAKNLGPWAAKMEEADAVINLVGESIVAKRWTSQQKEILVNSRLDSTKILVDAMRPAKKKPSVFINASAVGYYGDVSAGDVAETHQKGIGFLADLCAQWEGEAHAAKTLGVRVVMIRTGIVLSRDGGALQKMIPPFQMFMGGPLGNGKQWFPWVHLEDEIGAILFALTHSNLSGPVNVVSPNPVTMNQFCQELGKAMHRPSWAPVPAFMLRLLLGEMADEMLLTGQRAIPQKLLQAGYSFKYSTLPYALSAIFQHS